MRAAGILTATATVMLGGAVSAFAGELALGNARARPGQTVTVPVTYSPGTGTVAAALATDIRFDSAALTHPRCAPGSALAGNTGAAKSVTCAEPQAGVLRLAVYGFNQDAVPPGEVARVTFDVASEARARKYTLGQQPSASDAQANEIALTPRNGSVRIGKR